MKILKLNLVVTAMFVLAAFSSNAQSVSVTGTSHSISNEGSSDYLSVEIENRLKLHSVSGEIPASFPKYVAGNTTEEYVTIMKSWAITNLNLIKKEYHEQVLSETNTVTH